MTKLNATDAVSALLALANPSSLSFPRINADNTAAWRTPAQFRGDIGGTTVGQSIFTLANPSAISFLRINADNTTTSRSAANFRTDLGLGTGDSPTLTDLQLGGADTGPRFVSSHGGAGRLSIRSGTGNHLAHFGEGGSGGASFPWLALGSTNPGVSAALVQLHGAANTLYQRNGTNPQTFLLAYNWNGTNDEFARFGWTSGVLQIGTDKTGTGTVRGLEFVTGGVSQMGISPGGVVTIGTHATGTGPGGDHVFKLWTGANQGLSFVDNTSNIVLRFSYFGLNLCGRQLGFTTLNSSSVPDVAFGRVSAGLLELNSGTAGVYRDLRVRSIIQQPPASITPPSNGDVVLEFTNNTTVTIRGKGTDGTVRSGTVTLS